MTERPDRSALDEPADRVQTRPERDADAPGNGWGSPLPAEYGSLHDVAPSAPPRNGGGVDGLLSSLLKRIPNGSHTRERPPDGAAPPRPREGASPGRPTPDAAPASARSPEGTGPARPSPAAVPQPTAGSPRPSAVDRQPGRATPGPARRSGRAAAAATPLAAATPAPASRPEPIASTPPAAASRPEPTASTPTAGPRPAPVTPGATPPPARPGDLPPARLPGPRPAPAAAPAARPAPEPDLAARRRRGRVRSFVPSRGTVRHVDVASVAKVSVLFYLVALLIFVVADVILWYAADAFGTLPSIEKSVRTLFSLKSFQLHVGAVAGYTAAVGLVISFFGTIANIILALLYNLIADVVGGVRVEVDQLRED